MSFIDGSAPRERTKPRRSTGKTKRKAGGSGRSIYDVYEPSELERSHLTDKDAVIRLTDVPERYVVQGHTTHGTALIEPIGSHFSWVY